LLTALAERAPPEVVDLHAEVETGGLVRLAARGSGWQPRVWVSLATQIFSTGATKALVGTRALLGEGWDAPCVNCLVDLSAATTSVSVTQMRGRSLRLDPADPDKIASNWDIVAVAPELARGDADYERFVRKHLHLFAPSEDGAIEAGPSHVHPSLSPFTPPPAELFDEIDREMARRSREHELARKRWAIGEPYLAEEQETLVVRARRSGTGPPRHEIDTPVYSVSQRVPYTIAGAAAIGAPAIALAADKPIALAVLAAVPAAVAWAYARLARTRREIQETLPLDFAAYAVRDAYRELGELSENAAASLAIEPRASGYLRVWLRHATPEESARFTTALDDVVDPAGFARYLVERLVPGRRTTLSALLRTLTFRPPFDSLWVPVPLDLGRRKERAVVFARAWRGWFGPGELVFTQRTAEGKAALAAVDAQSADYEARTRRIWH
jgi:hypothetical protein